MYKLFTKLIPRKIRYKYFGLLKYNNVKIDPESFLGFIIFFGLGISLLISFLVSSKLKINYFIVFLVIFIAIEVFLFTWLNLQADKKSKFVEMILPDFLQLMSGNLRAGMTTDKSLLLSAREEFGTFQEEISRLGKEISTGKEIEKALLDLSKRIKSEKLDKTVLLLVNGIKSGGELAELLDQTANNLRNQKIVEERVRTNILLYVIFIFAAISFGAPILFGLSTFLVQVISQKLATVEIPPEATASLPLQISKVNIDPNFVITYAIISLIVSSILGSMVIGLISKGKAKYGIKYIPIMIFVSLLLFFTVRKFVASLLGELFSL